jgi:hypothetical protein
MDIYDNEKKRFLVTVKHEIETYYTVLAKDEEQAKGRLDHMIAFAGINSDGLNKYNIDESENLTELFEVWDLQHADKTMYSHIVDEVVTDVAEVKK